MEITQQISGFFTPYQYEDITVDATQKGFTVTKIKPADDLGDKMLGRARLIVVYNEGAQVRWNDVNGTAPAAGGPGKLLGDGGVLTFANLQAMLNARFTRETTVNSTLRVTYYR